MLIPTHDLQLILAGQITVVFRRWAKPTVKSGGTLRTAVGVLAIESVEPVLESDLTASDARAAGFPGLDALHAELGKRLQGVVYRISVRWQGPDPRTELSNNTELSPQELEQLRAKLARLDQASKHGAWTFKTLHALHQAPGCRAADVAQQLGFEKEWLKLNIRKLKELGLTQSLETGYRVSPRGEAFLSLASRRGDCVDPIEQ
jgi:hypothetical protein